MWEMDLHLEETRPVRLMTSEEGLKFKEMVEAWKRDDVKIWMTATGRNTDDLSIINSFVNDPTQFCLLESEYLQLSTIKLQNEMTEAMRRTLDGARTEAVARQLFKPKEVK